MSIHAYISLSLVSSSHTDQEAEPDDRELKKSTASDPPWMPLQLPHDDAGGRAATSRRACRNLPSLKQQQFASKCQARKDEQQCASVHAEVWICDPEPHVGILGSSGACAGSAHEWQPNTGMHRLAGKESVPLFQSRDTDAMMVERCSRSLAGRGLVRGVCSSWLRALEPGIHLPPRLDVRVRPTMVPVAAMMARSSRAERSLNRTDDEVERSHFKEDVRQARRLWWGGGGTARGIRKGAGGQVTGTARVGSGEAPELIADDVSR
jgi:hypothetical protein